jgi:hypothetical protein
MTEPFSKLESPGYAAALEGFFRLFSKSALPTVRGGV